MSTIIIHEECVKCGCPDNPYHKKNGCELKEYDGVMLQRYVNGREVLCYPNAGYFGDCDEKYTFTLAKSRLLELITKDMMTDDSGEYKELEKYVMKIVGHIHLLKLEDC